MKKKELITIKNVYKTYDMGKAGLLKVLKDINLEVYQGDFVVITGPSGSGKSTMMNIVGALDTPTRGEVYLQGKNISKMTESEVATLRGETIGFIFQKFNLIPTLTALDNVMLPNDFIEGNEEKSRIHATKILGGLGLSNRLHHKPGELSGGQQQRVAIARSLSNNPEIILADEPTGNLDSKSGQEVMNFLRKTNQEEGKTIILITHDQDLIQFGTKVVELHDGVIINIKTRHKR
ncbi:MAG: ABC transporter ATP-binding protein [Nanoarchaeota archaeon]|jgi:putative ABC transport system ATP-binding protein|nr:ABC transporter ATP-binding protein [Nanoarchaeota archaeon]